LLNKTLAPGGDFILSLSFWKKKGLWFTPKKNKSLICFANGAPFAKKQKMVPFLAHHKAFFWLRKKA